MSRDGSGFEDADASASSNRDSAASDALARVLRQRLEMGTGELFLETFSRKEILDMVHRVRSAAAAAAVGSASGASVGSGARADSAPPSGGTPASESGPSSDTASAGSGGAGASISASTEAPGPGELTEEELAVRTGDADEETVKGFDYETLRDVALGCRRCGLAEERTQVVFADGARTARLMVVGEAPGAREDATGLPFVGPAGKLLDLLLATVDLSREESVYICNVIKCRPPGNRNPLSSEIEACAPYLRRQIELVSPEAILAVGTFAGRLLTGRDSTLGNLRGDVYSYEGVPLLVTYHPAALLRNRRWVRPTWDDLQLLRGVLDGSA